MPMPITPELAAFMRSLGYDQLRQAYKEKYGKPYPMFCLSETKISGAEYMEELRAQFPGEDIDALIKQYTDPRPYSVIQKEILEEFEKTLKKPL